MFYNQCTPPTLPPTRCNLVAFQDYILTIVCLKQAILALFRILRINKNPLICRRDLVWAVRDSNPRPPGCKPRVEDYFSIT